MAVGGPLESVVQRYQMTNPDAQPDPYTLVAEIIGYTFKNTDYLDLALMHSSAQAGKDPSQSNERLEFLGDRVLGLAIAEMLLTRFPNEPEGDIAKRFTGLVRRETLAEIAKDLTWDQFIVVDKGERTGDSLEDSILGDAMEALIAAIHLDGGWGPARDFVARFWTNRLDIVKTPPKDAKTKLQEWVQAQGSGLPMYREIDRHGPSHSPTFKVEVRIDGEAAPVCGSGRSKRAAEQAAAAEMLVSIGVTDGIFPIR